MGSVEYSRRAPSSGHIVDATAPGNEKWLEEYRHHIPVVHLNGKEILRHGVDERRLRELLRRRGLDD